MSAHDTTPDLVPVSIGRVLASEPVESEMVRLALLRDLTEGRPGEVTVRGGACPVGSGVPHECH